jgi:hypothetical protein
MKRVVVTRAFGDPAFGIYAACCMTVCAAKDAGDKEVLETCNAENPSGTSKGWTKVVRKRGGRKWPPPVTCAQDPERVHLTVLC